MSDSDSPQPAVEAIGFESLRAYQSAQHPSYTSWVSLFPGERGQWYLALLEVTRPEQPRPPCSRQHWYEMSLPVGYDQSQYRREIVLLESQDNLRTWQVLSRQPCTHHEGAGTFAQVRTINGRFLRFMWSCYADAPDLAPNEILFESTDNGRSWRKLLPFHHPRFVSYPHRLRTLRDGTFVLCLPLGPRWGKGTDRPVRAALRLDVVNELQMTLFFSHDQGQTWAGPLPILGGQNVTETDFVELPEGDLLFFNNAIFANPGRQVVYRQERCFTPGPLERVRAGTVPETVCLTEEGLLVGCLRPGKYYWSDDLGQTWQELAGIPERGPEMYQPWIHALKDGRLVCAGHFGADDAIGSRDQYLSLHFFRLKQRRPTRGAAIWVERDFDAAAGKYRNAYTLSLASEGQPLAGKELEVWYVERDRPGYDPWGALSLEERMQQGGKSLRVHTDPEGRAHIALPHLDRVEEVHLSYQLIARFNADRADPEYRPAQTPQMEFYANSYQGPG